MALIMNTTYSGRHMNLWILIGLRITLSIKWKYFKVWRRLCTTDGIDHDGSALNDWKGRQPFCHLQKDNRSIILFTSTAKMEMTWMRMIQVLSMYDLCLGIKHLITYFGHNNWSIILFTSPAKMVMTKAMVIVQWRFNWVHQYDIN